MTGFSVDQELTVFLKGKAWKDPSPLPTFKARGSLLSSAPATTSSSSSNGDRAKPREDWDRWLDGDDDDKHSKTKSQRAERFVFYPEL